MSVWFGFHLPSYTHPDSPPGELFDRVVEQAKAAEEAGFRLVTVMDHLYQIPGVGKVHEPMLESWMTLAAIARETSRVRLGTLVTGVTYRNPALLAKEATTLDVISGGRAIFGLGAAWNDVEHQGYGFDFPPIRERMDRLEDALAIAKAMFTEERPTFRGKHHAIEEALNSPRPVQAGGPPILIGGVGEQRTLRIAAKYADMTHWFALGLDALKHKTRSLSTIARTSAATRLDRAHDGCAGHRRGVGGRGQRCARDAAAGASPVRGGGHTERAAEALAPYIDAGFTGFTFNNNLYRTPYEIGLVGEVLRLVTGARGVDAVR